MPFASPLPLERDEMSDAPTITYPPEMLPSPDDGEEAEVIVIHPDTHKAEVVAVITPLGKPSPSPPLPS